MTRNTREAVIMPRVPHGLDVLITCLDTQVTTATKCRKYFVVIINAVRFLVLPMEDTILEGAPTRRARKALHMPGLVQRMHHIPDNFFATLCASIGKVSFEAIPAENLSLVLDETGLLKWDTTVWRLTHKTLGMPVFTNGLAIFAPDWLSTGGTDGRLRA